MNVFQSLEISIMNAFEGTDMFDSIPGFKQMTSHSLPQSTQFLIVKGLCSFESIRSNILRYSHQLHI
jgi:hypothetical protein